MEILGNGFVRFNNYSKTIVKASKITALRCIDYYTGTAKLSLLIDGHDFDLGYGQNEELRDTDFAELTALLTKKQKKNN